MSMVEDPFAGLDPDERADAQQRLAAEGRQGGGLRVLDTPEGVTGELRFRSLWWIYAVGMLALGIFGAIVERIPAIGFGMGAAAVLMVLHGCASVRRIVVADGAAVAIGGVFSRRPIALLEYHYVRAFMNQGRASGLACSMLVFYAQPHAHPLAHLRGFIRRSANRRRAVLITSWWRDQDGKLVSANAVATLVQHGCRKAGLTVHRAPHGSDVAWTATPKH